MSYTVVDEFVVVRDGKAVHHMKVGSVVELSDDEAAALVAAGKVVVERIPGISDLRTGSPVEGVLRDVETGEELSVPPLPVVVEDEDSAQESASATEPKSRRRRGFSGD